MTTLHRINPASIAAALLLACCASSAHAQGRVTRIVQTTACGWAGSGRAIYVENRSRIASATVTIRQSYRMVYRPWDRTFTVTVPPGGTQYLGCSRDDSIEGGLFDFRITGESSADDGRSTFNPRPKRPEPTRPIPTPRRGGNPVRMVPF